MRPITVSVGPLAGAATNNISTGGQPVAGGSIPLNGSLATSAFVGTASISGNVLNVSAVTSGYLSPGTLVTGINVKPCRVVRASGGASDSITGVGGTGTYIVDVAQAAASATVYGGSVATLDNPRRVLLTFGASESTNTFSITGVDVNGEVVTETLAGAAVNAYTNTDFKTVTSISSKNAASGSVTVGTNGVGDSPWVRFDEWTLPYVSIQADVTGTVNYTIQTSMDDPNFPASTATIPTMNWVSSLDPNVVGATTTQGSFFNNAPLYARILLNSGSGSVSATFAQSGVVSR